MADLLPILYQRIADFTGRSCAKGAHECSRFADKPTRCCEKLYCDEAARFAKEHYGIELQPTGHPELPFMGEHGCVVAPHLRPICAMHVCTWSYAGVSHIEKDMTKSREYMTLRKEVLDEAERQGKVPPINFDVL